MALQEELEVQGNKLFRYRGTLPLLLLFVSIPVFIYAKSVFNGFDNYIDFYTYELICFAVSFFGLAIRIYTVGYITKELCLQKNNF